MKTSSIFFSILIFHNIFITSIGIIRRKKPNACESLMNNSTLDDTSSSSSSQWECLIIGIRRQKFSNSILEQKLVNQTRKSKLVCVCSMAESCVDNEEFILESDLIDRNEYVNIEFALGENFYTKQCVDGLKAITSQADIWECELQYDRLDKNEYYCNCKREFVCLKQKTVKIDDFKMPLS